MVVLSFICEVGIIFLNERDIDEFLIVQQFEKSFSEYCALKILMFIQFTLLERNGTFFLLSIITIHLLQITIRYMFHSMEYIVHTLHTCI